MKSKKIIGLIGGMGPHSSVHFYKLLLDKAVRNYGVKNNNDFPEIILDSVPVPDFISDKSNLPMAKKMLITSIKSLSKTATIIGMVCNTAHILTKDLEMASKGKFISMINLVAEHVKIFGYKKIGILCTHTTRETGLYSKCLEKLGIKSIYLDNQNEKNLETIIRIVLAGKSNTFHVKKLFMMTDKFVAENNLDGIILGCTELPLIFPKDKFKNVIDCMDVLADELLVRYYQGRKYEAKV